MCSLSGKVAATAIMAGAVPTGKIAFLVNTAPLRDEERCRVYYRQLCMATIRLLLFLSSFPRRKPTANVRWCYRLYDSEKARPATKVGLKTESFLELNSASLEAYFSELKAHMGPKQSVTDQAVHSRVLASALGSLVLELPWDKPELRSPSRYSRIGPGQTRKIQQRCKPTDSRLGRENGHLDVMKQLCVMTVTELTNDWSVIKGDKTYSRSITGIRNLVTVPV